MVEITLDVNDLRALCTVGKYDDSPRAYLSGIHLYAGYPGKDNSNAQAAYLACISGKRIAVLRTLNTEGLEEIKGTIFPSMLTFILSEYFIKSIESRMKAEKVKSLLRLVIDTETQSVSIIGKQPLIGSSSLHDIELYKTEYRQNMLVAGLTRLIEDDCVEGTLANLALSLSNLQFVTDFMKSVNKGRKKWGDSRENKLPLERIPLQFCFDKAVNATTPFIRTDLPYTNGGGSWRLVFMPDKQL